MAKFRSVYPSLGFYVNDQLHNFTEGRYETDEPAFIDVLSKLGDVTCEEVAAPKAKAHAKPKATPKAKAGE